MIKARIVPRTRDLGDGFSVRRALPSRRDPQRRPVRVLRRVRADACFAPAPGSTSARIRTSGSRPSPTCSKARSCIATASAREVTIRPGEVNWMTAGRGIVHSERTPPAQRRQRVDAVRAADLGRAAARARGGRAVVRPPRRRCRCTRRRACRCASSSAASATSVSPVATLSETFYADARLDAGRASASGRATSRSARSTSSRVRSSIGGERADAGHDAGVRARRDRSTIEAPSPARVMLLGGEPLDGPRFVWWNFVSSRKERIREAAEDWKAQRFAPVPGETEFIPLPERSPGVVDYP